jgi:hypothetical protein
MAAICQFHQHGHCKFAAKSDKIRTAMTCNSFTSVLADINIQPAMGTRLRKHLLGMIRNFKEEIDEDRVKRSENESRVPSTHSTRPAVVVVDSKQQIVHLYGELTVRDEMTLAVALDGIANILATAENLDETDELANMVDECRGLNRIHQLQHCKSEHIWRKCVSIMERFFPDDDHMEEVIAPMTTKADKVKKKEHTVFMIFICPQYCNLEDSCNGNICVARNNVTSN